MGRESRAQRSKDDADFVARVDGLFAKLTEHLAHVQLVFLTELPDHPKREHIDLAVDVLKLLADGWREDATRRGIVPKGH